MRVNIKGVSLGSVSFDRSHEEITGEHPDNEMRVQVELKLANDSDIELILKIGVVSYIDSESTSDNHYHVIKCSVLYAALFNFEESEFQVKSEEDLKSEELKRNVNKYVLSYLYPYVHHEITSLFDKANLPKLVLPFLDFENLPVSDSEISMKSE